MRSLNSSRVQSVHTVLAPRTTICASIVLQLIICQLLTCQQAMAQEWAKTSLEKSPRHLEFIDITSGKRKLKCFVAYPEVKGKATAVLVIHEIFGLTDWVRSVADQLAARGYIAIAPDLLSGVAPGGGGTAELGGDDKARREIAKLTPTGITADLDAAAKYVSALPACNGKLVVSGFCWGGKQTFDYANKNKNLKAAYPFYGTGPSKKDEVVNIRCPVYGFYAERDSRVGATLPDTIKVMKEAKKTFEPVTYAGSSHGFMRAGESPNSSPENAKAKNDAWKRWEGLLKKI